MEWTIEALIPFAEIEMVGYDPLGYTDAEHEFHKKAEFIEMPFFKEMGAVIEHYQSDSQKDLQERQAFVQRVLNNILGNVKMKKFD